MKKKNIAIFSLLFIMLVVSGCASYDITQDDAYAVATNAALGTPPPPKYQTAAAALLSLTLTPTPNGGGQTVDVAATMIYENMAAGMTQQVMEQQLAQQKAAATATAVSIKATAQRQEELRAEATQGAREMATARAGEQIATATQAAIFAQGTATQQQVWIEATATERSWVLTVTADAKKSEIEDVARATAQAAEAIRLEGESRQIQLAVERQEIKNKADAILPWTLVIAALIIAGALAYMGGQFREIRHNPDGTMNLPFLRTKTGWTLLRPDLLPMPAAAISRDSGVVEYQPTDNDEQAEVTRRAQAVLALRALPPGRERQALQIASETFGGQNTSAMPTVEILPPGNVAAIGPVLDELEGQVLDHE